MWWLAAQTQWVMGVNGPVGLNYAGVESMLRMRGEGVDPERFDGLQICERAALRALRDKRERESLGGMIGG